MHGRGKWKRIFLYFYIRVNGKDLTVIDSEELLLVNFSE